MWVVNHAGLKKLSNFIPKALIFLLLCPYMGYFIIYFYLDVNIQEAFSFPCSKYFVQMEVTFTHSFLFLFFKLLNKLNENNGHESKKLD